MRPGKVNISKKVGQILVNAAIRGYEAPYKQERLGILLGRVDGGIAIVNHAIVYRGGNRTRTEANLNQENFARRVRHLSRKHSSQFIGTFHSHVEVAGSISSALSIEDRTHLCDDPPHLVELIVAVWISDQPARPTQRYLQAEYRGYRFRISGYQMFSPYRLIPVFVVDGK